MKWIRASRYQQYQEAGLPPPPEYVMKIRRRPFPWEGFVKIVLSILVSILSGSLDRSSLLTINIFIFFLISGVVDILIFYHGYRLLPEGLQSLLLSVSFSVTALVYFSLLDAINSQAVSLVILLTILLSLISLLETVIDNRLIKFSRSYFTLLLASWLVHAARYTLLNYKRTYCDPFYFQFDLKCDECWLGVQPVCLARGGLGAGLHPAPGHVSGLLPQHPPPARHDPGPRHRDRGPARPRQDDPAQERGPRHQGGGQELREERPQCRGRGAVGQRAQHEADCQQLQLTSGLFMIQCTV